MKCFLVVTGRGLGGDAVIALNAMNALERRGVECEIALDESAPGVLFEKKGYSETQIVSMYAGITLVLCLIGVLSVCVR